MHWQKCVEVIPFDSFSCSYNCRVGFRAKSVEAVMRPPAESVKGEYSQFTSLWQLFLKTKPNNQCLNAIKGSIDTVTLRPRGLFIDQSDRQ